MRHPNSILLQRFVDGELGSRRARKISGHLESCSECRNAVENIQGTGDLLRFAVDDIIAEAPLEGLADRVLEGIAKDKSKWTDRFAAWLGESYRYRRKLWAPPAVLAGAAAAVLIVLFAFDDKPQYSGVDLVTDPQGSSEIVDVSFGATVDGTVFELEDKDGSTTTVIWLDEAKTAPNIDDSEAKRNGNGTGNTAISQAVDDKLDGNNDTKSHRDMKRMNTMGKKRLCA